MNEANLQTEVCGLCGAASDLVLRDHWGFKAPTTFNIFHCVNCDTRFAAPMQVDSQVYDLIYRNAAQVPGYDRYARYRHQLTQASNPLSYLAQREDIYWSIAHVLAAQSRESLRILEVGSGLGYLTYALNRAGYQCDGIDISSEAVAAARREFGEFYSVRDLASMESVGEGYDVVIATELIEHVPDPQAMLGHMQRLLKPGGSVVLTTPDMELYSRRYAWHTDPAPVHFWWFSKTSLRRMAWQAGMEVRFVDFHHYFGVRRRPAVASKPQTFGADGAIVFRDSWLNGFARRCVARWPSVFKRLAQMYIAARALGKLRSDLYNDSMILCVVLRQPGRG
ncbi:class I SAM-dependent methyltransferase [Pseudoduganella sp. UC29_106]|uniref:class I SAM-dependent methyltransferase n=1 Tax=Pseudoduganella sp. UC29_106 TaxID=3374553 RepID=UPI003757F476